MFNAIGIVIYMAVAFVLSTTIIGGFVASGTAFMIAAISYLLMGVKIKKKGVFTISGILLGLVALSGGHIPHSIFAAIGGVICDFVIGNYENKGRIILGYGLFALADFLGTVVPILLFGTASFVERATKWKMSEEQINQAISYFSVSWTIGFGILTFILACIGAFIAIKLLKKHFKKAGVI
ncbi:MptD family putative ECF transporter S component [Peptostreptococcus canis]